MTFLSDDERRRIARAIESVEAKTRGELVTVIARAADDYLYIPLLWAALLALMIPAVILFSGHPLATQYLYEIQIIGFLLLAIVFNLPVVKQCLIPRRVKQRRAHRLAKEQFITQNLHDTVERTGILLLVSIAERYVEIIADKGINDKVPPGVWDQVIADFTQQVKTGQVADGFVGAIEACGQLLMEHFPARKGDKNELPNHLIELD